MILSKFEETFFMKKGVFFMTTSLIFSSFISIFFASSFESQSIRVFNL